MVVAAARITLHVHSAQSLKQKRGAVRAICARLRNRFNLSVAEVGGGSARNWALQWRRLMPRMREGNCCARRSLWKVRTWPKCANANWKRISAVVCWALGGNAMLGMDVHIGRKTTGVLKRIAAERGISEFEAMRLAFGLLMIADEQNKKGRSLVVLEGEKKIGPVTVFEPQAAPQHG